MSTRPLLILVAPLVALAQTAPANLDFESGTPGQTPPGWVVATPGYAAEIRHEGCKNGSGCAVLLPSGPAPAAPVGNVMQAFAADAYRGKAIRLRAWLRVDKADPADHAQMWLRADRPALAMGLFDDMSDRPIVSSEWRSYQIEGEVEPDATAIYIGVISFGKSQVWIDDLSFEVLPPTPQETAARADFQKLYARIDAAYAAGTPQDIAALALPGAESASKGVRKPLSALLASMQDGLSKGAKFTSRTTVSLVRLSGNSAAVSTRTTAGVVSTAERREFVSVGRDLWSRTAQGWKLKEAVELSTREVTPPLDQETAKAVIAELKQRTVPLATVTAGAKMDDLAAFGKAVGDARIVALGEATHGTREFFQMKHRLFEYLVKEKGFTVFAIEANWPEALAVDRYIKTGEGDAKTALSQMYFWTWKTEEVRDLIEWMRAFNQAPGNHPTLSFTSFDMQTGHVAAQAALDYLKRYFPAGVAAAEAAYADVGKLDDAGDSDDRAKDISERVGAVLKLFDSSRAAMESASSAAAWRDARQAAEIAHQACALRVPGSGAGYRDQMMAKNVEWLADEAYPAEKLVLWAHNNHVAFGRDVGPKSMGAWLRERFGKRLYVAGFEFRRGQLRAFGAAGGQRTAFANHDVPPAPESSGAALLSAAGMPLFFLDLSALPPSGPLGRWLGQSHLFYDVGAIWQTTNAESNLLPNTLSKAFDGLIFVEETHAARGLEP